jgi:hypothetical protein
LIVDVLTKPDRVQPGDEAPLLALLKEPKTGQGYYVIRRPSTDELSDALYTPTKAHETEERFFSDRTLAWHKVDKSRRGVKRVAAVLSDLLLDRTFAQYIPLRRASDFRLHAINRTVEEMLKQMQKDLNVLGEPKEDPRYIMNKLFNKFFETVKGYADGNDENCTLQVHARSSYDEMCVKLQETKREFITTGENASKKTENLQDLDVWSQVGEIEIPGKLLL